MIQDKTPITLAHVSEYIDASEKDKPIVAYIKKYNKLSKADADKLIEEIRALDNPKIREETIIKIVDMHPEDAEDLNKIFLEVSLTEEESNSILALVKKY
tara:strand:- start:132 stop:431 length:300 start_codon:yes stop_codon:yes gene_type:complete